MTVPLPNPQNPQQPGSQTIQSYYWSCNVNQPGSVTYHFQFGIYGSDSTPLGYYQWNPFITITQG